MPVNFLCKIKGFDNALKIMQVEAQNECFQTYFTAGKSRVKQKKHRFACLNFGITKWESVRLSWECYIHVQIMNHKLDRVVQKNAVCSTCLPH